MEGGLQAQFIYFKEPWSFFKKGINQIPHCVAAGTVILIHYL
jgi:hypothetical protein